MFISLSVFTIENVMELLTICTRTTSSYEKAFIGIVYSKKDCILIFACKKSVKTIQRGKKCINTIVGNPNGVKNDEKSTSITFSYLPFPAVIIDTHNSFAFSE